MNAKQVAELAHLETQNLSRPPPPSTPPPGRRPDTEPRDINGQDRPIGAYWPLGADRPHQEVTDRLDRLHVTDVAAIATTLVVQFIWRTQEGLDQRYLLALDLTDWPGHDLLVTSGRIFETLVELTESTGWPERFTTPISPRLTLVLPTPMPWHTTSSAP